MSFNCFKRTDIKHINIPALIKTQLCVKFVISAAFQCVEEEPLATALVKDSAGS